MILVPIGQKVYIKNIGYAVLTSSPDNKGISCIDTYSMDRDDPYLALQSIFQPSVIHPNELDSQKVQLLLIPTGYKVFTISKNLNHQILVKIKIFFDKRALLNIKIPVNATIQQLKKKVFHNLGINSAVFYQTRLFYPLLELQELHDAKMIWETKIPENAKLVMITKHSFNITIPKQSLIKLKNQTIQKAGNNTYSTVLGDVGWQKTGKYYWQVRIDKFQNQQDIFVGVAYKNIDTASCPTHCKFWGIIPLFAKRFSPSDVGNLIKYGTAAKGGDNIGVLVQFINKKATISFFLNGMSLGIAYQQVVGALYPAITLFGSNNSIVQVSYDPRAPVPYLG